MEQHGSRHRSGTAACPKSASKSELLPCRKPAGPGAGTACPEPTGADVPSLSLGWDRVCPQATAGWGVRDTQTGVGSPGRRREDEEARAEREESPHGVSALRLAAPTIYSAQKTPSFKPAKNNCAGARARKGNRGHGGGPGRVSPPQSRAASASGNYLPELEDVFSPRETLINRSLESSVLPGRPRGSQRHGQRCAESSLPARAPPALGSGRAGAFAKKGNTGSSGKEQGNDRISLRQILTKVQSIRLRNEPLRPVVASTAVDITRYSLSGAGK